jgi:hypothetical protein
MTHKKPKSKTTKPSKVTLEKMGFTISGHWAERNCFQVYLPTLTYNKLFEEIQLYGENIGKTRKLQEIQNALEIK